MPLPVLVSADLNALGNQQERNYQKILDKFLMIL